MMGFAKTHVAFSDLASIISQQRKMLFSALVFAALSLQQATLVSAKPAGHCEKIGEGEFLEFNGACGDKMVPSSSAEPVKITVFSDRKCKVPVETEKTEGDKYWAGVPGGCVSGGPGVGVSGWKTSVSAFYAYYPDNWDCARTGRVLSAKAQCNSCIEIGDDDNLVKRGFNNSEVSFIIEC